MTHASSPVVGGPINHQDWADHLSQQFWTYWASAQVQAPGSYLGVEVRDIHDYTQAPFTSETAAAALTGGNPLPMEIAVCISLRTALIGRRHRGRIYSGSVSRDIYDITSGFWNTSATPALLSSANAWRSASETGGITFPNSNWGVTHNNRDGTGSVQVVTHLQINPAPCSQRRRGVEHRGRL